MCEYVTQGIQNENTPQQERREALENARALTKRIHQEQLTPCAPRLWMSETNSAIRTYLAQKQINSKEAEQALLTIHALHVVIVDEDNTLCLRALELAGMLAQSKAYDAFYLATAEKMEGEFWTTDERLHNRS